MSLIEDLKKFCEEKGIDPDRINGLKNNEKEMLGTAFIRERRGLNATKKERLLIERMRGEGK